MSVRTDRQSIQVCAHWQGMENPVVMGYLYFENTRGKQKFSFEYIQEWLDSSYQQTLDPHLQPHLGIQHVSEEHANFGLFLDSAPDRWGRMLLDENEEHKFNESDYLLRVYDKYRIGAFRFRYSENDPFLDNQSDIGYPTWIKIKDLYEASWEIQQDHSDTVRKKWLEKLVTPGTVLGGARHKINVPDENNHPWIAKFPQSKDKRNIGKWEYLAYILACDVGIEMAESKVENFSSKTKNSTFLTKRFDRTPTGERIHFASAMTLLGKKDGDGCAEGVSYLDLADFLIQEGGEDIEKDLKQLWQRIVFSICISNTDDHLRNHGFLLKNNKWSLSPAYDINPSPNKGGLVLNINREKNNKDFNLLFDIANDFDINNNQAEKIIDETINKTKKWRTIAKNLGISNQEMDEMKDAFWIPDTA